MHYYGNIASFIKVHGTECLCEEVIWELWGSITEHLLSLKCVLVAFSEMWYFPIKTDNERIFAQHLQNKILPDHTYGVISGGDPLCIPDLTWEQLKQFHATHYHPSNSRYVRSMADFLGYWVSTLFVFLWGENQKHSVFIHMASNKDNLWPTAARTVWKQGIFSRKSSEEWIESKKEKWLSQVCLFAWSCRCVGDWLTWTHMSWGERQHTDKYSAVTLGSWDPCSTD